MTKIIGSKPVEIGKGRKYVISTVGGIITFRDKRNIKKLQEDITTEDWFNIQPEDANGAEVWVRTSQIIYIGENK